MNLYLGFPRFVLGFFLLFSLLAFWGCESGPSDSETGNSEEAFYPIDFCIVTGNDFDEEGSGMIPYTHVHKGITIKFCCKPCLPKFNKDPEKYLVILDEEMEALDRASQTPMQYPNSHHRIFTHERNPQLFVRYKTGE